jgi:acetyltransferase-like isoleucine patch superfamily enzyme
MLRSIADTLVRLTRPLVWRIAQAYDLKIERRCWPTGQHPVVLEDPASAERTIPKSVVFNTRSGSIRIGADTVFGEDVHLLTGKHLNVAESAAASLPLHHVPASGRDIVIGRHCYLGDGVIVIGPVTIGDYAVIGAGAVVTHDVPARAFVAGVPAKIVRQL